MLGHAFTFGLQLLATADTIRTNPSLKQEYENLKTLAQSKPLTPREESHVKAICLWAEGKPTSACEVWENILIEWPTDIHALKMAHDSYFYLGDSPQIRDSVARVLPVWEAKRPPLKSYLYGFYAFGLEENNHFDKAETYGRKGLEENRFDGWSTHSLAHCFEMQGQTKKGMEFMSSTIQDWERCNFLACHNHWHTALYYVENEEFDVAAEILEKELLARAMKSKAPLDMVDSSSLLWRLKMLCPKSLKKSQCDKAYEICKPFSRHHVTTFNDAHFMMAYLSGKKAEEKDKSTQELLETYAASFENGEMINHRVLGTKLLEAFIQFRDEKYSTVVDLLEPIRYKLNPIGGSNAQRDLFNLMLIVSALKSANPRHRKLSKVLIAERDALKGTVTKLSQGWSNILKT